MSTIIPAECGRYFGMSVKLFDDGEFRFSDVYEIVAWNVSDGELSPITFLSIDYPDDMYHLVIDAKTGAIKHFNRLTLALSKVTGKLSHEDECLVWQCFNTAIKDEVDMLKANYKEVA